MENVAAGLGYALNSSHQLSALENKQVVLTEVHNQKIDKIQSKLDSIQDAFAEDLECLNEDLSYLQNIKAQQQYSQYNNNGCGPVFQFNGCIDCEIDQVQREIKHVEKEQKNEENKLKAQEAAENEEFETSMQFLKTQLAFYKSENEGLTSGLNEGAQKLGGMAWS